MENNDTARPIFLTNARAIKLIQQRAKAENRSLANAAAHTIIEALGGPTTNTTDNNSGDNHDKQEQ